MTDLSLAMRAGARAIINNPKLKDATFVWLSGDELRTILYTEAAILLDEAADKMEGEESDANRG